MTDCKDTHPLEQLFFGQVDLCLQEGATTSRVRALEQTITELRVLLFREVFAGTALRSALTGPILFRSVDRLLAMSPEAKKKRMAPQDIQPMLDLFNHLGCLAGDLGASGNWQLSRKRLGDILLGRIELCAKAIDAELGGVDHPDMEVVVETLSRINFIRWELQYLRLDNHRRTAASRWRSLTRQAVRRFVDLSRAYVETRRLIPRIDLGATMVAVDALVSLLQQLIERDADDEKTPWIEEPGETVFDAFLDILGPLTQTLINEAIVPDPCSELDVAAFAGHLRQIEILVKILVDLDRNIMGERPMAADKLRLVVNGARMGMARLGHDIGVRIASSLSDSKQHLKRAKYLRDMLVELKEVVMRQGWEEEKAVICALITDEIPMLLD